MEINSNPPTRIPIDPIGPEALEPAFDLAAGWAGGLAGSEPLAGASLSGIGATTSGLDGGLPEANCVIQSGGGGALAESGGVGGIGCPALAMPTGGVS